MPWLDSERDALNAALTADRLGHAPMFTGSAGVGKRALADWLVERLLCLDVTDGEPCGACESCRLLPGGTHPDFFRLSPEPDKKEIRVDQVREFIESVTLTASLGGARVGRIDPADRMNRNAANALLKTLEEPADGVWLVLVTDRPDRLPVTVRSRCQLRPVAVPPRELAERWLAERHSSADPDLRTLALALADGAPRVADGWLADDGLARGLAIRDHLGRLLQSGSGGVELPAEWVESPEVAWPWLARWTAAWMKRARIGRADGLGPSAVSDDPTLFDRLEALWQDALQGRNLASDPIRHDWLMLEWLARWRALAGQLPVAE
nr:DNA polymerase III subunit delta' [Wenzhouxiangella sp. XN79A]